MSPAKCRKFCLDFSVFKTAIHMIHWGLSPMKCQTYTKMHGGASKLHSIVLYGENRMTLCAEFNASFHIFVGK